MNVVNLIGRLGADPEMRHTQGGKAVCNFRIATDEGKSPAGERRSEWHYIVCWEQTAEAACRFLRKGYMVGLTGRLQTRQWEDNSGGTRYRTEIVATRLHLLDNRAHGSNLPYTEPPPLQGQAQPQHQAQTPVPPPVPSDDVPF